MSPGANSVTPSPTDSTMPAPSCPTRVTTVMVLEIVYVVFQVSHCNLNINRRRGLITLIKIPGTIGKLPSIFPSQTAISL